MKLALSLFGLVLATSLYSMDDIVEFRIPAGTGTGSWNTPDTKVQVKVGQTLRIINDDSTVHRLHTNGRPCPHQPKDSQTGEYYDCKITSAVSEQTDKLYDHNHGSSARFYLEATATRDTCEECDAAYPTCLNACGENDINCKTSCYSTYITCLANCF